MRVKNIIGLLLLVGFSSVLFYNFGSQVGGYMNFGQAEATGSSAHVVGTWHADVPVRYDQNRNLFRFHMQDDAGQVQEVHYFNPKPANFEDAEKLVVEGQMRDGVFVADHILVKCPSKYNETNPDLQAASTS